MSRRCDMEAPADKLPPPHPPPQGGVGGGGGRACRDTAVTALFAFGLFLPLIGFNTVLNIHNELILETRWPLLAILVGIIAAGRFVQSLLIAPWLERCATPSRPEARIAGGRLARHLMPCILGFAALYPALA